VTGDPIRETLRKLPRKNIGVPQGFARISRGDVETSSLEVAAVEDWLRAHGGQVEVVPTGGRQLGGGSTFRKASTAATSYLIPLDAL
jgi:hypothetical protein